MKLWCDCCDKVQPVEVTDERCAKTYAAYQDIVCTECRLVIASGSDIRCEHEACARVVDEMADEMEREQEPSSTVAWVRGKAAAIRTRGQS